MGAGHIKMDCPGRLDLKETLRLFYRYILLLLFLYDYIHWSKFSEWIERVIGIMLVKRIPRRQP